MGLEALAVGHPKRVVEELVGEVWELRHELKNESGDNPHLYEKDTKEYTTDNNVTVYCGRVYSNVGIRHNCGISFHAWLSEGKCKLWSANGHRVDASPEHWGTCSTFQDLWYSLTSQHKYR